MTRLDSAAPVARGLRTLVSIGTLLLLAILVSSCTGSPAPVPTPDPFAGLADRSDQAFRQGLESYGQGMYREALTSFEQARTLSPTVDPRIDTMIERSKTALAPTPTPVPPTPTEVPAAPSVAAITMSTQAPDTDLGLRYFGQVTLAVVPGQDSVAPPATQFFFQDQIGLHIDGLKQHLRLPLELRVFNADSAALVADIQSDTNPKAQPTSATPIVKLSAPTPMPSNPDGPAVPTAPATPLPQAAPLARFWDTYVWYHQGGETPGHYKAELYANGVLTNTFDYTVVNVPIASTPVPQPTAAASPTDAPVVEEPTPAEVAAAPIAASPVAAAAAAPAAVAEPTSAPTQVPSPTPTIVPTPANAYTTVVGGMPAGLDVDASRGRFYLADTTGVIWSSDSPTGQQRPTLGSPFNIGARSPVDLAVDQSTGYLYLSTKVCSPEPNSTAPLGCVLVVNGSNGALLKSISLPGASADLRIDSELGLLYVAIPELQSLAEVDIRGGKVVQMIDSMPQITSLAVDPLRHTVYAAHLGGQMTVIDGRSGRVTSRLSLTGPGLASVATARGLAYAINTATHELAVVEPISQAVSRYPLSQEPAAVAASEASGAIYVLSSRADVILQIDPTDGTEVGRVLLASRSGHPAATQGGAQTLRPRMVLDAADQTLFASLPDAGSLAAVTGDEFPTLARAIPYVDVPDQSSADSIPGVLRPAADADAPTLRAHAPNPQPPTSNEDGL
jgi:hypothetical protein